MKKLMGIVLGLGVSFAGAAQEPAAATAVAEVPASMSPAQQLYRQAVAERAAGRPKQAIQTATQIVVCHADDAVWLPKAELLCAELYIELELFEAAEVTARQIQQLHEGSEAAVAAGELRKKISELKKQAESDAAAKKIDWDLK